MGLIILYFLGALSLSFLCSVLEAVLLSTPMSFISMKENQGNKILRCYFCHSHLADSGAFRNHPEDHRCFLLAFAGNAIYQDYPYAHLHHLPPGAALGTHH